MSAASCPPSRPGESRHEAKRSPDRGRHGAHAPDFRGRLRPTCRPFRARRRRRVIGATGCARTSIPGQGHAAAVRVEDRATYGVANAGGLTRGSWRSRGGRAHVPGAGFHIDDAERRAPRVRAGRPGAVGVALVGAPTRARQESRADRVCADQACRWRRSSAAARGKQDQRAAAMGGFMF
jgi:hypothetical protein